MSSYPISLRRLATWVPVAILVVALVVSIAIIAVGFRSSPASPERPIRVSSGTWAPFVGPDLPGGGPLNQIVTESLRGAGYVPEVSYTSWALATSRMSSGSTIGVFPLVGSEDRRSQYLLSDPLMDFEYVLFYDRRVGTPEITSPADISAMRVGGIAGYDYWQELDDAVDDYIEFDNALDGLEALARGDIDVLAVSLLSGRAALNDPSFSSDAASFSHIDGANPLVSSIESLYFMMDKSDQSAQVMTDFNKALAALKLTSEYDQLISSVGTAQAPRVTLEPWSDSGLVELLHDDGSVAILSPRGTAALVLDWPLSFTEVDAAHTSNSLVRVKITSGPSQGRVFFVDATSIVMAGGTP